MSSLISNKIDKISKQLIQARKYNYCDEPLDVFLHAHPAIICKHSIVTNKHHEKLSVLLLKNIQHLEDTSMGSYNWVRHINPRKTNKCESICIVYGHGLGSNKYEMLTLAKHISQLSPALDQNHKVSFDLCSFDFSGSGKSEGQHTTYGIKEQDDINAILTDLDESRQYSKYVLWGRSMGGVAMVLSQSRNLHPKIQCIILDSPFSIFEQVAVQIASFYSSVPQIVLALLLEPLKKHFYSNYAENLNPFTIDLTKVIAKINSRIMLIYSPSDSLVKSKHSKLISKYCRRSPVQLQIQQDHNKQRLLSTCKRVLDFIHGSIETNWRNQQRRNSKSKEGQRLDTYSKSQSRTHHVSTNKGISLSSKETAKFSTPDVSLNLKSYLSRDNSSQQKKLGHSIKHKDSKNLFMNTIASLPHNNTAFIDLTNYTCASTEISEKMKSKGPELQSKPATGKMEHLKRLHANYLICEQSVVPTTNKQGNSSIRKPSIIKSVLFENNHLADNLRASENLHSQQSNFHQSTLQNLGIHCHPLSSNKNRAPDRTAIDESDKIFGFFEDHSQQGNSIRYKQNPKHSPQHHQLEYRCQQH